MKLTPGPVILKFLLILLTPSLSLLNSAAQDDFRIYPYLQNPSPDGITIIWFSYYNIPGQLSFREKDQGQSRIISSVPVQVQDLAFSEWENDKFFGGISPLPPFKHRIRLDNLKPQSEYMYSVNQGNSSFTSTFLTGPPGKTPIRVIFYADSETEPESVNNFTDWPSPDDGSSRSYLTDQATGYKNNIEVILSRRPDLVFIAGDLVECGGEQRDWDEFWNNNTNRDGEKSLGSQVPIFAAAGNHEYFEGPYLDQYNQPGSERAIRRFLSYFESPGNNSGNSAQEGRYYSLRYGPAAFIVLDVCNNGTNKSDDDTNFYLLGENDPGGGNAPDINPGSDQYNWLESQLKEAQLSSMFTFIIMHHSPYSSGPHGFPPGETENTDNQSGYPLRDLTGLFMKYGVDAVISGHDEIWERSEIQGIEINPDKTEETHTIQFFDVGIGGDGLRGPERQIDNSSQKFIVQEDVPEVWQNNILISGGKHYGHLEVDIESETVNKWNAVFRPVYVFPLFDPSSFKYSGYERRVYGDEIKLEKEFDISGSPQIHIYPNPFRESTMIEYFLPEEGETRALIFNFQGQKIKSINLGKNEAGFHSFVWNGADENGKKMSQGIYFCRIETGNRFIETVRLILYK